MTKMLISQIMVQHLFGIVAVAILSMLILIHRRPVQSNQGIVIQHVQADTNQQQFFANYHSAAAAEGNYLIGFEDSVENITTSTNDLQQLIPQLKIRHIFPCLKAISVSTLSTKHAHFIQSVSTVAYIDPDDTVEAMRVQKLQNVTTSWGIDRVDGKIDQRYHYAYTGRGVRVYIIDSGIQVSHNEFQTTVSQKNSNNVTTTTKQRARCGKNLRNDLGENCNDEWGHGTHVAAIIGGKTYGVAKNVNLVALKVFGADGTSRFSDIIAALEFVVQQKRNEPNVPMVINMSLGTKRKAILLNRAVDKATEAGIPVVVAAGNGGINACRYSPASASSAITVAASTAKDQRLSYSNWGRCVDLYAPGDAIWSAWSGTRYAGSFQTGTSSAAPYVTGAVALYLEQNANMTPAAIQRALQNDAFVGRLSNKTNTAKYLPIRLRKETPNLLLNVGVFRNKIT